MMSNESQKETNIPPSRVQAELHVIIYGNSPGQSSGKRSSNTDNNHRSNDDSRSFNASLS